MSLRVVIRGVLLICAGPLFAMPCDFWKTFREHPETTHLQALVHTVGETRIYFWHDENTGNKVTVLRQDGTCAEVKLSGLVGADKFYHAVYSRERDRIYTLYWLDKKTYRIHALEPSGEVDVKFGKAGAIEIRGPIEGRKVGNGPRFSTLNLNDVNPPRLVVGPKYLHVLFGVWDANRSNRLEHGWLQYRLNVGVDGTSALAFEDEKRLYQVPAFDFHTPLSTYIDPRTNTLWTTAIGPSVRPRFRPTDASGYGNQGFLLRAHVLTLDDEEQISANQPWTYAGAHEPSVESDDAMVLTFGADHRTRVERSRHHPTGASSTSWLYGQPREDLSISSLQSGRNFRVETNLPLEGLSGWGVWNLRTDLRGDRWLEFSALTSDYQFQDNDEVPVVGTVREMVAPLYSRLLNSLWMDCDMSALHLAAMEGQRALRWP